MNKIRFVRLDRQYRLLRKEVLARIDAVSRRGNYVLGAEVEAFERRWARLCGTRCAVSLGSGSDALFLSLKALGVGPGDEVITSPLSFVATAAAVARTGARPVFTDVGGDMNMDPALAEKAVTRRTKALMPVHLTGKVADMEAILRVARRRRIPVVEDAAQAVGASRGGRRAGSFGRCAAFSLHPLKNLHVHGDGGVVTTDDRKLRDTLLLLRNHGLGKGGVCEVWGFNSRLDELQAGIANVKLARLSAVNARFREIARVYSRELKGLVRTPAEAPGERPVYHRYIVRHPRRDRLRRFLASRGIETRVNYRVPLHLQPAAAGLGYRAGDLPAAEEAARTMLSLPIYAELSDWELERVVSAVRRFCR